MAPKNKKPDPSWVDPDDAKPWTDDMFARAEIAIGDRVVREAAGTVTKRGRPKLAETKQQISIRLDPAVIAELKRVDPKWQVVMQEVLADWARRQQASRSKGKLAAATGLRKTATARKTAT